VYKRQLLNIRELKRLASELKKWDLTIIHPQTLKLAIGERIFYEIQKLGAPGVLHTQVQALVDILSTLQEMKLEMNIWKSQNYYFSLLKSFHKQERHFVNDEWKEAFFRLGSFLNIRPTLFEPTLRHQQAVRNDGNLNVGRK